MVNIVKCKPKVAECESDKKKGQSKDQKRQQGGDAKTIAAGVATNAKQAANGQKADDKTPQKKPCPSPEIQEKGKKADAQKKADGNKDSKSKSACGPKAKDKPAQKPKKTGGSTPAIKRVALEDPPPIAPPVLHAPTFSYAVPNVQLARSALKFPQKKQQEQDTDTLDQANISAIFSNFNRVNNGLVSMLQKQQQTAIQSSQRIQASLQANTNYVLADQKHLDAQLLGNYQQRLQDLVHMEGHLRDKLDSSLFMQRLMVYGVSFAGRRAIRGKINTVEQSIGAVVGDINKKFTKHIKDSVKTADNHVVSAFNSMLQWQAGIDIYFPTDTEKTLENAANEGRRQVANCRAQEEISKLECKLTDIPAELNKLVEPFQAYARASVEPVMREEAKQAEKCGFKAVDSAVDKAIGNLQQANKDGKRAVSLSVKATKSHLSKQLNAARKALAEQSNNQLTSLHNEAETAHKRVAQAHENQKQGMVDSLQSYRQSIIDAAPDGIAQAKTLASSGAGETQETFNNLRQSHLAQCRQIERGSRQGLEQAHSNFWASSSQAINSQQAAANSQTESTRKNLAKSTGSRIGHMTKIKNGVQGVVDFWAMDMAKKYAKQIAVTKTKLETCEPQFDLDLKAKNASIKQWLDAREKPKELFKQDLHDIGEKVKTDVSSRVTKLVDEFDDAIVHDDVINDAVRGVTKLQGKAVEASYNAETKRNLKRDINEYTSGDDKTAIKAYLKGDQAKGAEFELKASIGFWNDDEARIRKVMRSLDDENLKAFLKRDSAKGVIKNVKDNLGGVDLEVFTTLTDKKLPQLKRLAKADAYELKDKLRKARTRKAVNQEIEKYYTANPDRGYASGVSNDDLRRAINEQMAVVRGVKDKQGNPVTGKAADKAMQSFVGDKHAQIHKLEQMRCQHHGHAACYKSDQRKRFDSAQEDRAKAIIQSGVGSKADKIALLGIEANRAGGGKMENIDKNLVDPRLNPSLQDPARYQDGKIPKSVEAGRKQALEERQQILAAVAKKYGNPDASEGKTTNEQVIKLLSQGQGKLGKKIIKGLVEDGFPSPETSANLIKYATGGYFDGTNEALLKQAVSRLDRNQIAKAEKAHKASGGKGTLWGRIKSETSGQDYLDLELAWMGQPRNDREKAEVALFAIHQQRRETGSLGKHLMSGSGSESILDAREERLRELIGGDISFSEAGQEPKVYIYNSKFDKRGFYTGDRTDLLSTASAARGAADNYAKNIDEWADGITTAISIIGAVVATVVTGGGAAPLLAAAIAGGFGLAGMAAKHVIKGGRYGWEEALTDLGTTGIQMVTAGLGQKLQAIAAASKTMGPVQQALMPAVITGGLDSMGQTVLNEGTWKDGFGKGMEEILANTMKGVLTSSVSVLSGQALQKIPIGKAADDIVDGATGATKKFTTLGDLSDSTNFFSRSASQSFQSGASSFLSTGAGIGFDSIRGKYQGNWEDAFKEMAKAGGQAAFQGSFEGGGEALRDKNKIKFGLYTKPGWMSDAEFAAAKALSRDNNQSGTAAAVDGSRFRGDLHDTPVVQDTHVKQGLKDLTADGGFMQDRVRVDPDGDGSRVLVKLDEGSEIPVKFKTVDEMTLTDKGVPVAEFHPDGDGFVVHVSSKADPDMIQRAMVHEMTEIRHLKRKDANTEDVLRPGGLTKRRPNDQAQLSPHDRARIAELEFIQHQIDIAQSKTPPDQVRIKQLGDETLFLLAHLGVVNNSEGAKHRRELLNEHLPNDRLRKLVGDNIAAAQNDVRLQYRGADHDAALDMLAKQWQQHMAVGDTATAHKILQRMRRRLMRSGDIKTDRRFKDEQKLNANLNQLLKDNSELASAMDKLLSDENKVKESALKNDPAAEDPHGAQAVRREFGDSPQFQDWQSFKDKFFTTFKGADPNDPIHIDHAYYQWSTGAYVNGNTGRLRSVLSDVARPHPDFQHKWVDGKKPAAMENARLTDHQQLDHSLEKLLRSTGSEIIGDIQLVNGEKFALSDALTGSIKAITDAADPSTPATVDKAAKLRHELLNEARRLDAILKTPGAIDSDNFVKLKQLHHDLEHQAIKLSETLGEAAANNVAKLEKGNWEPVPLEGQGAGLPDVVYRNKDTGQLLVIEAKGGGSTLGTRLSKDGRMRVEQGTRAYLESLAKTMQGSSSEVTRKLGDELLAQLAKKDGVDYRLVKQRFDAEGKPQTPDVGRFDIGDPPNAATTHRNAAAIPNSDFHGVQRQGFFSTNSKQQVQQAAKELIDAKIGIGSQMQHLKGNVYKVQLDATRSIYVELNVVSHKKLDVHATGTANAKWQQKQNAKLDDGVTAVYKIDVSKRMDPEQIGRALAHELREVQQDALAGSNTHAEIQGNEHTLNFATPHGRARLEEVAWLNHKIAQGDANGKYRRELAALLQHLGADASPQNIQRRQQIAEALMHTGGMTAEIWHSINGAELLNTLVPFNHEAFRQIKNSMLHLAGNMDVHLVLGNMDVLGNLIQRMNIQPDNPHLSSLQMLQQQREALLGQLNRAFVQLPGEGQHHSFVNLAPFREQLYHALGINNLYSLSRLDTEYFIQQIYQERMQAQAQGATPHGVYQRYKDATVAKYFVDDINDPIQHRRMLGDAILLTDETMAKDPDYADLIAAARVRNQALDLQHQIPDNVTVYAHFPPNAYSLARGEGSNDYIHFEVGNRSAGEGHGKYRIYINPTPSETVPMVLELVNTLIANPNIDANEIKTHSDPRKVQRETDAIVLYSDSIEGHRAALEQIYTMYQNNPQRFVAEVPHMTLPRLHGVSEAEQPTGTGSFGRSRTKLFYDVWQDFNTLPQEQQTYQMFRQMVLDEFAGNDIDPFNPHQNLSRT